MAVLGMLRCGWVISRRKRPMEFPNHVGLCREPEGPLPDGGLHTPTNRKPHQTGEPRGLSPSGGNSAAKPFSLEYPRALWARCGVQGVTPCREPEGLSPDGGLYTPTNRESHQTSEPGGLSPSGGNSAAKQLSLEYPRAPRARCGVQGVTPCREPRGPSPSGGLGDESVGNARPSAERSQSAILICIALRAYGAQ